ncbi:MAG: conjugal transfer protein TraX [Clostridia bacterium]|nr:conjugal transfer protein TraX [Clostridia bacterium]
MEKLRLNAFYLKLIAIITMVIDHAALVLVPDTCIKFINNNPNLSILDWPQDVLIIYCIYEIMRTIGRIAFPIFCFFIVEGFIHTKSIKKYILRLGIFALLSEIPFDLASFKKLFYFKYQNVMFTLLIGLLSLCIIKLLEEKFNEKHKIRVVLTFATITIASLIADFLKTDYSFYGVLAISLMYIFRDLKPMKLMAGFVSLVNTSIFVIVPFSLLALYNGERGRSMKYFFYAFYPVHLFILYLIAVKLYGNYVIFP